MQIIQVRGIADAVQGLQIVALQKTLGDVNLLLRHAEPGVGGKHRHLFSRSHKSENDSARLDTGIRGMMNLVLQLAAGRLRRGFEHMAFDVVLPTVIDAPQAAFFVAAEKQRSAAMGTVFAEQSDLSSSIAESDEVFAEQTHAHGRAIGFGNFLREQGGDPIAAKQTTHRGAGMHSGQQLVFFFREHASFPPRVAWREFL